MTVTVFRVCILLLITLNYQTMGETTAELKLMHRRNPTNTTVLYYLANACLQENDFNQSLQFFSRLRDLSPNHQNLSGGIARSLYGLNKIYDSYETCLLGKKDSSCEKFLEFFQYKQEKRLSLYQFKFALNQENLLDLMLAERLLKSMPDDSELLESLANYFMKNNLSEMAFDFFRMNPDAYARNAIVFRKMVRDLRQEFNLVKRESRDQERLHYLGYYIWKFAPEFGDSVTSPDLKQLINFFEDLLSSQSGNRFENYYRLIYLQSQADLKEQAKKSADLAQSISPNYIYSFALERMLERQLKQAKILKIR